MQKENVKFKIIFFGVIFLSSFFLWQKAEAATYYIDYETGLDTNNGTSIETPWKLCPGMVGFAGIYAHSAGDIFVFKGGVTWPAAVLPLAIGYSGTAGNIDHYTSDQAWYSGESWSRPKLVSDGNANYSGFCTVVRNNQSYVRISYLELDAGMTTLGAINVYVVYIHPPEGAISIELDHCVLKNGKTAFTLRHYGNVSQYRLHDNTISDVCNGVVANNGSSGLVASDVQFYNNLFAGVDTIDCAADHQDGIQISNNNTSDTDYSFSNVQIYNNQFRGKWMYIVEAILNMQWINGLTIYNNLFTFENTTDSSANYIANAAAIALGYSTTQHNNNVKIYNNTISSDANYASTKGYKSCIKVCGNQGAVDIKNNILSNCEFGINAESSTGTTLTADYNFFQRRSGGHVVATSDDHMDTVGDSSLPCTKYSWECHSISGNPLFTDAVSDGTYGSMDFSLQSISNAKNAGTDLSSYLTTDISGNVRSGTYDIGAYEYTGVVDAVAPASPTGLAVS